ncbi:MULTISPECIES: thymidine phosphorylase [unclassified Lentimonas]|uniref:thymidine phosphorylase n=2 Tax=unclassified Lentimonas TaxID=2630993 RepID=UPI0013260950|nr:MULTISPECIES: thymidine phosphorylase [unclassified Lentimonas]CAA6684150.1 Pyrimidine-nucleoside phosphorylase (EC [Lentimonas sp. CC6]CAA7170411.1 Pyrimidine-nucleoside phosphorylase (EC [Lentimonas sp. CC21]CAA6679107.1 Pyrimidine-nucleoside phosphorylase (EC [Lentimonas sp. CC4]CAA7076475.1 Pyrimidine-nucleoside phosphorylase (EC [Lentimonas sp. CC4]CAA7182816.1 Pyrimidine-nucleoside phosphorylase (EC [Lentimonas sp. CC8]
MITSVSMDIPQEIIAIKRDGGCLSRSQIEQFVAGVVSGDFKDYQASALLMAIVLKGMTPEETAWMTEAMMRSGRIVELPEITRPKVDKHSTGGVGDKVSLILAPLAASVGLCVPMMSGRGLGHTGGTLDKLEAIPGFTVDLSDAAYRAQLASIHQAMIGQSADMVPADRKLYALRDVTATVESIPLICASILSKKLAEGIDALVLDVKCGRGAFMKTESEARELAESLVRISAGVGKPTTAVLTRMDQPLGCAVGNALEVIESIDCLKGQGPEDLMAVTFELVAEMLRLGGLCHDRAEAQQRMDTAIESGAALAAFRGLVAAQGGDARVVDDLSLFAAAGWVFDLCYTGDTTSYIAAIDALLVGEAARLLGAGRAHADAVIDLAVGIVFQKKTGDRVEPGDVLCQVHYNTDASLNASLERLRQAMTYSFEPVETSDIIIDHISES